MDNKTILNVDDKYKDTILMEARNYFGNPDNKDLFLLAASLGYLTPSEIKGKKYGYVRWTYFNSTEDMVNLILAYYRKNMDLENLDNDIEIGEKAEKAVNSGIEYLTQIFENKNDAELDEFFLNELYREFEKIESDLEVL